MSMPIVYAGSILLNGAISGSVVLYRNWTITLYGSGLTRITEKPGKGNEPSDMVNILVHLHTDPETLLHYISQVETKEDDVYEQAIDGMCKDHHAIQVVPYTGTWMPIKYPWHIFDVVRYFIDSQKLTSPPMPIFPRRLSSTAKLFLRKAYGF